MTIATKQCREYVAAKWPDAPISRKSCRDTAGGSISQHSSYGATDSDRSGYDSNAIDIFAPGHGSDPASQAYIQRIVDDLTSSLTSWSIRKIIWKDGGAHENHAHVDFYPMCRTRKWCNDGTPTWRYSDGREVTTRDPEPENGLFTGEGMPRTQWHQMIDALFAVDGEFQGDPDYWKNMPEDSPEWVDFWNAAVREWSN